MAINRPIRGVAIATCLGVMLSFGPTGCGSGDDVAGKPAEIKPEIEQKTQDMLKNKSKDYNARYQSKTRK